VPVRSDLMAVATRRRSAAPAGRRHPLRVRRRAVPVLIDGTLTIGAWIAVAAWAVAAVVAFVAGEWLLAVEFGVGVCGSLFIAVRLGREGR